MRFSRYNGLFIYAVGSQHIPVSRLTSEDPAVIDVLLSDLLGLTIADQEAV